jgi:hypothetical protein
VTPDVAGRELNDSMHDVSLKSEGQYSARTVALTVIEPGWIA